MKLEQISPSDTLSPGYVCVVEFGTPRTRVVDKMQDVEILHREAMELVDQAFLARQRGDTTVALELTKAAFSVERAAADLVADLFGLEPTRSVLHRSAATLAVECSELREAEKLIGRALAGNPPDDIANELRDLLLEEIYSRRQAIGH